jgi:hypothetical protein
MAGKRKKDPFANVKQDPYKKDPFANVKQTSPDTVKKGAATPDTVAKNLPYRKVPRTIPTVLKHMTMAIYYKNVALNYQHKTLNHFEAAFTLARARLSITPKVKSHARVGKPRKGRQRKRSFKNMNPEDHKAISILSPGSATGDVANIRLTSRGVTVSRAHTREPGNSEKNNQFNALFKELIQEYTYKDPKTRSRDADTQEENAPKKAIIRIGDKVIPHKHPQERKNFTTSELSTRPATGFATVMDKIPKKEAPNRKKKK